MEVPRYRLTLSTVPIILETFELLGKVMDQVEVVTPPRTDDPFICTAYAEKVEPLAKMVEELLIEAASEIAIRLRPAGAVQ